MDKKEYRKLGRSTGNIASYSSIWLAGDHFLVCEDSGFIEKYKRFYFKDIQALIVKKTNKGIIISLVLFVLTMFCLWFLAHASRRWNVFWEILSGFLFLFSRGPTEVFRNDQESDRLPVSLHTYRRTSFLSQPLWNLIVVCLSSYDGLIEGSLFSNLGTIQTMPPTQPKWILFFL